MNVFVKICGITNLADARYCVEKGADYLGFIFYNRSPRYISSDAAADVIRRLPPSIIPVGVFVNESRDRIREIISETNIKILQFSGDETPEDCSGYSIPIWKAFRIRSEQELEHIKHYHLHAAVLDGASNREYGGSGKLPDLGIALQMKKRYHHVVVAGGISDANVESVVRQTKPYAIDVNSGVEKYPGRKDFRKIEALFSRLKQWR